MTIGMTIFPTHLVEKMASPVAAEIAAASAPLNPSVMKIAAVRLQVHLEKLGGSFACIDDVTALEIAAVIASLLDRKEGALE